MNQNQIDHYCELNGQPSSFSIFQSQTYRQLEFGLKELYRLVGFLKNYCVLNKQAVDKILKKHDKNSYFSSRGTINTAISHLSFFRQRDLSELLGTVENTWRKVDYLRILSYSLLENNPLQIFEHQQMINLHYMVSVLVLM